MRRGLMLIAVMSVLAPAHAQSRSPEVHSLAFPLSVQATLDRDAENGCSQSSQSVTATATVRLGIGPSGQANLRLEGSHVSNTGPSPGQYMAGDHEFTRLTSLHDVTWTGTASTDQTGLTLTFDRVRQAEIRFTGYGSLPLPAPTTIAFSGQMHCAIAATDVLPGVEADGEQPTSMSLVGCAWVGALPDPFLLYLQDGFVMGGGAGVHDVESHTMYPYGHSHRVRLPR